MAEPAPTNPSTIADIIRSLNTEANNDVAVLIAGAINLYTKSLISLRGNGLYGPEDAHRMLTICEILLDVPTLAQGPTQFKAREQ